MRNRGYSYRHVLGPACLGSSTISYLAREFSHSTEAQWRERLNAGEILLGEKAAKGSEVLRPGMILIWNRPGWIEEETPQSYGVVFQDEHILAVDKPSGLPTIPGAGYYQNTLLSLVQVDYPAARPLHRLGRATSGLVLFALEARAASILSRRWPQVQKQYLALASGIASEETYDIRQPIGEQEHPRLGKVHAASDHGKQAHSIARVVERRSSSTVFQVDLLTGRPHQIRIHLAFIGHPLQGDPLYAAGGVPKTNGPGLPGDGGYWLQARRLFFEHPISGDQLELTAPIPDALRAGQLHVEKED